MKKVKKMILLVADAVAVLMIAVSAVLMLAVVLTPSGDVPSVAGYSMFRVLTGSMSPEIPTNTLIVVRSVPLEEVQVGDIISFYSADPSLNGMVNTHRVTKVDPSAQTITTKGDANALEDRYPVTADRLIGVMVFRSHGLGVMARLINNPLIFIPLIVLPLVILLVTNLVSAVAAAKQIAREEEEQAILELKEQLRQRKEERLSAQKELEAAKSALEAATNQARENAES